MSRAWTPDPNAAISSFEQRHSDAEAGALLFWAVHTAEALDYLVDLDLEYDSSRAAPGSHSGDVIDVAHARWATGTCMTSLDLCAAALGRALCGHKGRRELDMGDFDGSRNAKKAATLQAQLPTKAQQWFSGVFGDPVLTEIMDARHALVHRRLPRHLYASAGSGVVEPRLELQVGPSKVPVKDLIVRSRDLARTHVEALLNVLPSL